MNLDFFARSFSGPSLGIDIGTTSIKIAECSGGKRPQLSNYGILEYQGYLFHSNKILQSSNLKLFDQEAIEALAALLSAMKPAAKNVYATMPMFTVFTTVVTLPAMGPDELKQAMIFQAKQYVPLNLSDTALDWAKVGEYMDDKGIQHQQVLLISVPQEQIRKYQLMFSQIGLTLKSLEIENFALVRALSAGDMIPTIIVDIGTRSTNIIFVENGVMRYSAQTDYAAASLTQAIAGSMNISAVRAEELKRERGILTTSVNYELSTIMAPFLDVIINEVKKAQFNYETIFARAKKTERIILTGGGANLMGIDQYFHQQFEIPVVKSAAMNRFSYDARIGPLAPELSPILSVALGTALQGVG